MLTVLEKEPLNRQNTSSSEKMKGLPAFEHEPQAKDPFSGTILMKDGRSAWLRSVRPSDFVAMRQFNHSLSIESLQFRFFTTQEPEDCVVFKLCEGGDVGDHLTLIAEMEHDGELLMVGHGVYVKCNQTVAEFSVAVLDAYQGLGIGKVLLERLAHIARLQGFDTFRAITSAINQRMLTVFRHSGFPVDTVVSDGVAEIDLRLTATSSDEA